MRRSGVMCVLMMTLLLSACGGTGGNGPQEQALTIRGEYLAAKGCGARLNVTADYGQRVYTYTVDVTSTAEELVLSVVAPKEVAGVTAHLVGGDSRLEYDAAVLETGPLALDGLTPLDAVPALLETARSGFMDSCAVELLGEQETLRVAYLDPDIPAGQGRQTNLWFDAQTHAMLQGEILMDGYRVILCEFEQFALN